MLEVLYEDNHLIAINKRSSDIVQADKTGDVPLKDKVGAYLKKKYDKPGNVFVGVTHRIDRPVSGVVLFARTSKALSRLNEMFKAKDDLDKTYWAIVKNKPKLTEAKLEDYLLKDTKRNKSFVVSKDRQGSKQAILEYKLMGQSDQYYLLQVKLHTGRHHQIRVQLAAMGCPIRGDLKYGYRRSNPDASICLHARYLSLTHPVKKEPLSIIAPVPNDKLWHFFEKQLSKQ